MTKSNLWVLNTDGKDSSTRTNFDYLKYYLLICLFSSKCILVKNLSSKNNILDEINELISIFLSSKLPALVAVSSIVCEVNKTVCFFIKHILNLKYTK